MSDLTSIASSAISVYERALSTVSNNIANVNTDGYTREVSNLVETAPEKAGVTYVGTGVYYGSVNRESNTFAETNLRNSNSDLSAQAPIVNYANDVINIMGSQTVGLSSALSQFYTNASALAASPASDVARGAFLSSTAGVASRFAEVSTQLDSIGGQAAQDMQSAISQVNTITKQLALLNGQLTPNPNAADQPAQLLDTRDSLLRQLSKLSRVNVTYAQNGAVQVSLGGTISQSVVVKDQTSTPIGLSANSADPLNIVLDPYGVSQTLSGASGGTIGGLKTFVSQVLQPAQSGLNTLAKTFVSQINTIQSQGVDGYGQPGQDLMKVDPAVANAAEGMSVIQSDGMRIATGAQFRVTENTANPDAVKSVVNYTKPDAVTASSNPSLGNNPNISAGIPINIQGDAQYQSVTTLAAGVNNPVFYLDNAQPGQQLQVITTDGRQLIGSPLSIDQQYQILTPANGFSQPVTYSTQYLNKSDSQGYMGASVFYGAKSDPIPIQQFDGSGNALPAKLTDANLVTNQINLGQTGTVIQAGAIQLDGVPLGELDAATGPLNASGQPTLSVQDVKNWIDAANLPDITVTKFTKISTPAAKVDFTKPLSIMDPNGNMVDIGTIPPGGTRPTQYHDMKSLVQAIQASSAQTQVTASIDAGGDLVITNLPGPYPTDANLGNPITLGPASGLNALGSAGQTYSGQLSITRTLADPKKSSVEFTFGDTGTPFDLSKVGLRTGAYIMGTVPDDVHVAVTGKGAASVAASFSGQPADPQQKLRNQSIAINFTSATHYTINDVKTGTELASREYDNTVNNPVVNFQGLSIKLSAPPLPGDSFQIDGNQDGLGNNQNMLVMANLANQKVLNGMTMGDNYTNQVNSVGNISQQATITQQALTVVNNQAVASRDAVSGVNLDDEATSLIKYQQAYEAAAKAMQIGTSLFSTIEAIRA